MRVKASSMFFVLICIAIIVGLFLMNILISSFPYRSFYRPKYAYFDLGSNNGDTLMNFFKIDVKDDQIAGGLITYSNFTRETTRWEVHAFEANPVFDEILSLVTQEIGKTHNVQFYNRTAAWTYDGQVEFFLHTVNKRYNFWGSSLKSKHPDVVNSENGRANITVRCVDVARVLMTYNLADVVVLKMDIEGAEYELLIDLLKKGAFAYIDYLAVEFHPLLEDLPSREDFISQVVEAIGTKFIRWY